MYKQKKQKVKYLYINVLKIMFFYLENPTIISHNDFYLFIKCAYN